MGNTNTSMPKQDPLMADACWEARKKIRKSREDFLKTILAECDHDHCENIGSIVDDQHHRFRDPFIQADPMYEVDSTKYQFPFENLVLEGGGAKGLAYCGVFRAFEEHGIDKQIHKFAGTSIGAIGATLFAVDASWGYFSLVPNLLSYFGWNPGQRILNYLGAFLATKTNNADITFAEVFKKYGNELCIVVTNVNTMTEEYCHVKTTPDMPVRLAVRMSMSIPGVFQAIQYKMYHDTSVYVDGGLICNYPVHCYDGWWLSLAPEDGFLRKISILKNITGSMDHANRFKYIKGDFKTIGCLVYSYAEQEYYKDVLMKKSGVSIGQLPDTELARAWALKVRKEKLLDDKYHKLTKAVEEFCKVLNDANVEDKNIITKEEFQKAFTSEKFTEEHGTLLFGKDCDVSLAFAAVDRDGCGAIKINEFMNFIEEAGFGLHEKYLGIARSQVSSLLNFTFTIFTGLSVNANKMYLKDRDAERSIGVNTRHISVLDFGMADEDKSYLIEQGRRSTTKYLQNFVMDHNLKEVSDDVVRSRVIPKKPSLSETDLNRLLVL